MHVAAVQQAPIAHADGPVQSVEHVLPLQRTRPLHDPLPRQLIVLDAPSAWMPMLHDSVPMQIVRHDVPLQVTRP